MSHATLHVSHITCSFKSGLATMIAPDLTAGITYNCMNAMQEEEEEKHREAKRHTAARK
jgi:hypothetical protein